MKTGKLQKLLANLLILLLALTNAVVPAGLLQAADAAEQTALTQEQSAAQDTDKKAADATVLTVDKSQVTQAIQAATTEDTGRKSKITNTDKAFQFGNKLMSHYIEQGKSKGPEWLKTTNLNFYISEDFKPTYSLETIQPFGERNNAPGDHWFWQGRYAYSTDAATVNFGVGWRTLAPNKQSLYGMNLFYDYGFQYDLARIGLGGEYFNKLSEYRFNVYHPLTGDKQTGVSYLDSGILYSYIRAVDGADFEMGTSFSRAQWLKAFLKGYYYDNRHNEDEIGYQLRTTMQVSPRFNLELGYRYSNLTSEPYAIFKYQLADTKQTTRKEKKDVPYDVSDKLLQFVERENDIKTESWSKFVSYKGSIKATVTSSVTGSAIQEATVQAYQEGKPVGSAVTTDASGNATISGLNAGSYTVHASYAGEAYTGDSSAVTVTKDTVTNASVSLAVNGGSASITVMNASGAALSGAAVIATYTSSSTTVASLGSKIINTILGVRSVYAAMPTFSITATANNSGEATFTNLPPGTYTFTAAYNGQSMTSEAVVITSGSQRINTIIIPTSGGNIYAVVKDASGTAVSGATVTVSSAATTAGTATTDQSGVAVFSGIAAGSYTIYALKEGYSSNTAATLAAVTDGNTVASTVILAANTTGYAKITVSAGGSPASGAAVSLLNGTSTYRTVSTDSAGIAKFDNIPVGSYSYTVAGVPGYQDYSASGLSVTHQNTSTNPATAAVALAANVKITVTVTDSKGAPVSGASVQAYKGGVAIASPAVTDGSGAATINGLSAGTYTLTATYALNGTTYTATSAAVNAQNGDAVATVQFTVPIATTLYITATAGTNGTITYGTGTIAAGTTVSIPVSYGASLTLNFIPATHYKVSDVTVGGAAEGAITTYTLSNITSSVAVISSYAEITYDLKVNVVANNQVRLEVYDNTAGSYNEYTVTQGNIYTVTLYSTHKYVVYLLYNYTGVGYNNLAYVLLNAYPTADISLTY